MINFHQGNVNPPAPCIDVERRRGEITALLKLPFPAATTTSTTAAAAAVPPAAAAAAHAAAGAHTHAPNTHFPARTHIQQARTDAPLAGAGNLNMQGLLSLPSFSPMEAEVSFQPIDVHSAMRAPNF